jgi:hypothetical protein
LFDKKMIDAKDFEGLYNHFRAICEKVNSIR